MCIYMFRKNRIFNGIVSKFAILWDSDSIFSYFIIHEKTDNIKWISIANFKIFFFFYFTIPRVYLLDDTQCKCNTTLL